MSTPATTIDYRSLDVRDFFPHRYPFLLVDQVIHIEEGRCVCIKNVSHNEPHFQGHFPELPIMPGVLLIEAMAQAGRFLSPLDKRLVNPRIARIKEVEFIDGVYPGDQVVMECILDGQFGELIQFHATAFVNDKPVTKAKFIIKAPFEDL